MRVTAEICYAKVKQIDLSYKCAFPVRMMNILIIIISIGSNAYSIVYFIYLFERTERQKKKPESFSRLYVNTCYHMNGSEMKYIIFLRMRVQCGSFLIYIYILGNILYRRE
jgi:hypothetical protein